MRVPRSRTPPKTNPNFSPFGISCIAGRGFALVLPVAADYPPSLQGRNLLLIVIMEFEKRGERRVGSETWGIGVGNDHLDGINRESNGGSHLLSGYRHLAEYRGSCARLRPGQGAAKIDIDLVLPTLQQTGSWRVSLRAISLPVVAGTFHARYRAVAASPFGR